MMAWTFRFRGATNLLVSTYATLKKMVKRTPLGEKSVRSEPLVVEGPYKYVRHPLYFGVVVMVSGWGLLTDDSLYET
jgi:protein-S-isoprenylcysteine O-methyltransferase Ste14